MAIERLSSKGLKVREVQESFINSVASCEQHPSKVSLIQADTGVGKTLGYLAVALDWVEKGFKVIIATPSHQLMKQIAKVELPVLDDAIDVGLYYGLSHYPSPSRIELMLVTETFSEQTENYLRALSTYKDTLNDFIDEYGAVPEEVDITKLTCQLSDNNDDVKQEREFELRKPIVITSHYALLADYRNKGSLFLDKENTVLIIDEGDQFVDLAEEQRIRKVSVTELINELSEHCSTKQMSHLKSIAEELASISQAQDLAKDDYTIKIINAYIQELTKLSSGNKDWQKSFQSNYMEWLYRPYNMMLASSKVRRLPNIVNVSPFITWNIGQYLCKFKFAVLVGGTLSISNVTSGFNWVVTTLNLHDSLGVLAIHSPIEYGSLDLTLASEDPSFPKVYAQKGQLSTTWLARVASWIRNTPNNILVLTSSHSESEALHKELQILNEDREVHRHISGTSIKGWAASFMERGGIMVTAAGHTGLNIANSAGVLAFEKLFITRLGMSPADDESRRFEAKLMSAKGHDEKSTYSKLKSLDYSRNVVRTVRRMKQSIGRCIRDHSHHGDVFICDPRFPKYTDRNSRLSHLRSAIPERFIQEYQQAKSPEVNSVSKIKKELFF